MKHLRILFVTPAYEPAWGLGGVVSSLSSLARALVASGQQVTVMATNADGTGGSLNIPLETPITLGGVDILYFQPTFGSGSLFDSRRMMWSLRQTISQFDIVYLAATYQWIGIESAYICARQRVPTIIFPAGTFDRRHIQNRLIKKMIWYHFFLKRSLNLCNALHLASEYERQESWKYIHQHPNFIAPHCIDIDHFHPRPDLRSSYRTKYGITNSTPLLISVGRMDSNKRLDYLFRALAHLKDTYDFRVLVIGNKQGVQAKKYQQLATQLTIADRIIWTGIVHHSEIIRMYTASDLLVHLSREENFSVVVAEAMASGLPVLVSQNVGIWSYLKDKLIGKCVALNEQSVAQELADFFSRREEWASWGAKASNIAKDYFSPSSVAQLTTQAFSDVIHGTQSPECSWHIP
jgi:glycosyltransferase involved in cell wall biosynthesis